MIIKGGSHSGRGLGAYLLQDKNDRAEVWEIRGDLPRDLREVLADWRSDASGTRCEKPLYHAQLNPDRKLSREEWDRVITLFEKEMGFETQPRAIVFHEHKGREHVHLVYSRLDEDGKALSDSWNYLHHEKAAREIEQELGLEKTQGALYGRKGEPRPERTPDREAIQQGERIKQDPKVVKAEITALYRETEGNAPAFLSALKEYGYRLAKGDQRGFVVVDGSGGVHSLTRMSGAKAGELRDMFKGQDLPSVAEIRTTQGINRAPSYAYLLDVISDGEKGEEITLLFSFMLVEIKGRNLQTLARALIKRDCAIIQEYDPAKFAPLTQEQPIIEALRIVTREG